MPQPRKLHDKFFKQAKAEGYVARSAYKLTEIDDRKRLLRRGDAVLDLGCAPGSWLQVALERIGDDGVVIGIDLQRVDRVRAANVRTLVLDVYKATPDRLLEELDAYLNGEPPVHDPTQGVKSTPVLGWSVQPQPSTEPRGTAGAHEQPPAAPEFRRRFDVVLSDMAPSTSGHGDDLLSVRLCRRVLELAIGVLRPGGHLAMKVLEGADFPDLLDETRRCFVEAKGFKPEATRDVSREMYIVGKGFRPRGGRR
jgi:23S rRNA (uridine2552-2'-O)-methyltransferase